MNWTGKIIGLLIGLATRRLWLIVLGVVLGHLYDIGFFSGGRQAAGGTTAPPPTRAIDDAYAVLGLSANASDEEIEQAWRRGMSEFHPDRVANAAQEIRDLAGERARALNGAYETIKRQRGR